MSVPLKQSHSEECQTRTLRHDAISRESRGAGKSISVIRFKTLVAEYYTLEYLWIEYLCNPVEPRLLHFELVMGLLMNVAKNTSKFSPRHHKRQ